MTSLFSQAVVGRGTKTKLCFANVPGQPKHLSPSLCCDSGNVFALVPFHSLIFAWLSSSFAFSTLAQSESYQACAGAKLQGKPGPDRAGLAQTQRKPAAAPTLQAAPLKKHRISGDLPQAASPAALAAGQPHATSARPPATKPSHKRKALPNDAAAIASRADVGGGSLSITQQQQQQQQKRRQPMPSTNQPTSPGSKPKSNVPPDAKLRALKPSLRNQPPAKHDAQAPPRPKAQQKLPAESVPRGVAASSHAERPPVVAQEMVATSDPRIAESQDASGQGMGPGKPTSPFQSVPAGSPSAKQKGAPTKQPPVSPFQEPANDSQRPSAGLGSHYARPSRVGQHADAEQKQSTALHAGAQQGLPRSSERGEPGVANDKAHASSRGLDGIPADLFTSSGRGQRQPLGVIDMVLFDSCR